MCEIVYEEIDNMEVYKELEDSMVNMDKSDDNINMITEHTYNPNDKPKELNIVSPVHNNEVDKDNNVCYNKIDSSTLSFLNDMELLKNDDNKEESSNSQMTDDFEKSKFNENHNRNSNDNILSENFNSDENEDCKEDNIIIDNNNLAINNDNIKVESVEKDESQNNLNENLNNVEEINKAHINDNKEKSEETTINNKFGNTFNVNPKEQNPARRISELYSQFNASWKDRLKSKCLIDPISSIIDNNENDDSSDVDISENEIMSDSPPISSRKAMCVESSCYSASDEISLSLPVKSKNVVVSSFDCGFDSENPSFTNISKKPSGKPIYTESSCNSTLDNFDIKSSESFNTIFRVNPMKPETNMTTTSTGTETGTEADTKSESTCGIQIDETYNNLEQKILPFVKSQHTVELRLLGRLSVFQRACVKQIAAQHKLIIKHIGKGKDSFIMLRKKVELLNAQKLFLEMKKKEMEKRKENVLKEKARQERLSNPPMKVSSGCQADMTAATDEVVENSKKAARRNRKKQWEMKQKQMSKRSSSTQTVAQGYYLCPYCEGDIPESHQSVHYPFCLSKYRAQVQSQSKSGNVTKDKRTIINRSTRPISSERKRSKSRENIKHSTLDAMRKELDKIHSNDINSMVNVINELSKRCVVPGCNKKKQKTCDDCTEGYCNNHFSPENISGDNHFNCPVALERAEANRLKNLGANNPLLKTVEELTAPKFADGSLLQRKKKRVRLVAAESAPTSAHGTAPVAQIIAPPNINETRTRNGPILSFERNELQKKLRERIGEISDRRTK